MRRLILLAGCLAGAALAQAPGNAEA